MYNPFSILNFFADRSFKNYWYESGAPSFLYEYIKIHHVEYESLVATPLSEGDFTSREIESTTPTVFFTQSGYLTLKRRLQFPGIDDVEYELDYPNKEVRDSMSRLVLEATYGLESDRLKDLRREIVGHFAKRNIDAVFTSIRGIIAGIPYTLHHKRESYYHSLVYTILAAVGLTVRSEEQGSLGRSDLVIEYNGDAYILEFKLDSVNTALAQIREKGHAERYRGTKNVYLVGVRIDVEKRNIEEWKMEKMAPPTG